jgi:hypothetical protein
VVSVSFAEGLSAAVTLRSVVADCGECRAQRLVLARTGRRVSEICLLDRDPLLPAGPAGTSGLTTRLRYQQTKIEGAPDTILVDEEIVAIIRAQQQWADQFLATGQSMVTSPKYLFLATRNNRNGDRPYSAGRLRDLLAQLARRLDVRDSTGAVVDFNRTHVSGTPRPPARSTPGLRCMWCSATSAISLRK